MPQTLAKGEIGQQDVSVQQESRTGVQRALGLVRQAIEDCEWKNDALDAFFQGTPFRHRSYRHQILNGDRPCNLEFLAALPPNVRKRLAELNAQQYQWVLVDASQAVALGQQVAAWLISTGSKFAMVKHAA